MDSPDTFPYAKEIIKLPIIYEDHILIDGVSNYKNGESYSIIEAEYSKNIDGSLLPLTKDGFRIINLKPGWWYSVPIGSKNCFDGIYLDNFSTIVNSQNGDVSFTDRNNISSYPSILHNIIFTKLKRNVKQYKFNNGNIFSFPDTTNENKEYITKFNDIRPILFAANNRIDDNNSVLEIIAISYDSNRDCIIAVYALHSKINRIGSIASIVHDDKAIYPTVTIIKSDRSYENYNVIDFNMDSDLRSNMIFYIKTNCLANSSCMTTGEYTSKQNMLIDHNTDIVVRLHYKTINTQTYWGPDYNIISIRERKVVSISYNIFRWWNSNIGYSTKYGYFISNINKDYSYIGLFTSKDPISGQSYDTSSIMKWAESKKCFKFIIPCISVSGKIAYLNRTALYLGGYFSYIDSQEVILNEGDNYIYITRDSNSFELSVDVYDHLIGIPGQSQFNRILISYMKVLNESIVYQNDYDIDYYGIK